MTENAGGGCLKRCPCPGNSHLVNKFGVGSIIGPGHDPARLPLPGASGFRMNIEASNTCQHHHLALMIIHCAWYWPIA